MLYIRHKDTPFYWEWTTAEEKMKAKGLILIGIWAVFCLPACVQGGARKGSIPDDHN